MQLDKLTIKGQEALSQAQSLAAGRGHGVIEPVHLLRALLAQPEGATVPVLQKLGVPIDALGAKLDQALSALPRVSGAGATAQPRISESLAKVLEAAFQAADQLQDQYVSTEHLLLGIAASERDAAGRALREAGVTRDAILKALQAVRGNTRVTDQDPESKYQSLEKYGRDLTELARKGKIDPVIGRDKEIRRTMQVLSRRTKNNPVLIGEPGVGKTAIVEGLARRIVAGDVRHREERTGWRMRGCHEHDPRLPLFHLPEQAVHGQCEIGPEWHRSIRRTGHSRSSLVERERRRRVEDAPR